MSNTKPVLILAIITVIGAVVGLIAINPFSGASVQANQGAITGAQKWEYCAITSAFVESGNFGPRGKAVIRYFSHGGVREEIVEFSPSMSIGERKFELGDDALAIAIARLGSQRWEMVSTESGTDNAFKPIYFKRPMP